MNSLKPGFADELLKLALYDRLLALFRLSPWIILACCCSSSFSSC